MMKNIVIFSLLLCCVGTFAIEENLTPDKVNAAALCQWLSAGGDYTPSVDENNDIVICKLDGDREFCVLLFEDAKILTFCSLCPKPDGFDVPELISWANKSDVPFVCVNIEEDPEYYGAVTFKYYLIYAGGLNRKNFMATVDWFIRTGNGWLEECEKNQVISRGKSSESKPSSSAVDTKGYVPVKCRTNGLMGMPNYDAAGRTVYVKNLSDETLKIHVEQDGAYGAFGISLSDATGDYTIAPGGEINFLTEVNRTLTISAPGYKPIEYIVEFQ